jgi:hypothetical protein
LRPKPSSTATSGAISAGHSRPPCEIERGTFGQKRKVSGTAATQSATTAGSGTAWNVVFSSIVLNTEA